jgi:hypothetical protein
LCALYALDLYHKCTCVYFLCTFTYMALVHLCVVLQCPRMVFWTEGPEIFIFIFTCVLCIFHWLPIKSSYLYTEKEGRLEVSAGNLQSVPILYALVNTAYHLCTSLFETTNGFPNCCFMQVDADVFYFLCVWFVF